MADSFDGTAGASAPFFGDEVAAATAVFFDGSAWGSLGAGLKLATAADGFALEAPGLKLATGTGAFGLAGTGDFVVTTVAGGFGGAARTDGFALTAGGACFATWTTEGARGAGAGAGRFTAGARATVVSFVAAGFGGTLPGGLVREVSKARASGATDTKAVRRTRSVLPERCMLPIHPIERPAAKNPGTYESA